jgi:hypothetical protein
MRSKRGVGIVLALSELAGYIGAGLAGAAYIPQVWHLIRARCSAGLSRAAFVTWLAASVLLMTNAVAIRSPVFIALGVVQMAATAIIVVYTTKYARSYCDSHLPCAPTPDLVSTSRLVDTGA